MLTSVVRSCARNGRKISLPAARLCTFSTFRKSPEPLTLTGRRDVSQHPLFRLLTHTPWHPRPVCLSALSRGDADPLDSPSEPLDWENFGSLSTDMASRRTFRKSSPGLRDLQYREDGTGNEEEREDAGKPQRRPVRRNTPYWYFLQCKKLIKENKVSVAEQFYVNCCSFSSSSSSLCLTWQPT